MRADDRNAHTIANCGGVVAASSKAFSMTRLGVNNVPGRAAAMQERAAGPANPLEVKSPEANSPPYRLVRY